MLPGRSITLLPLTMLLFAPSLDGQEAKNYHMVSFDEKGRLEDKKAWAALKTEFQADNPAHIFIIAHGWWTSKTAADEVFSTLAKLLREQAGNGESIAVLGVRWPSLLGESESPTDKGVKQVAKVMAGLIAQSSTVKEHQQKLKEYLKKPSTRLLASAVLQFSLPDDEQIDAMIDRMHRLGSRCYPNHPGQERNALRPQARPKYRGCEQDHSVPRRFSPRGSRLADLGDRPAAALKSVAHRFFAADPLQQTI